MEKEDFKHKVSVRVRFSEVDMLGVCNNAVYINYFEDARLDYMKQLGLVPVKGLFTEGNLFFIVRNEINYMSHSRYDDELIVYSKISFIKNSSFGFDHLVLKANGEHVAEGSGVIVQVDRVNGRPVPLTQDFTERIKQYEGEIKIFNSQ